MYDKMSRVRHGRLTATLISITCFLRRLPLFIGSRPQTPLRVLCLIAFDTLHVGRTSKPMRRESVEVSSAFLDFAAGCNASLDHKYFCSTYYQATRRCLEKAGFGSSVDDYLRQLEKLERRRPSSGDHFDRFRIYREEVARLALGTVASIALGHRCVEDAVEATKEDDDLKILLSIVMQCQLIDDVLDYAEDAAAGLPSFMTASDSPACSYSAAAQAARDYAACRDLRPSAGQFPLMVALWGVSAVAKLLISFWHWQYRRKCTMPMLATLQSFELADVGHGDRRQDLTTTAPIQQAMIHLR